MTGRLEGRTDPAAVIAAGSDLGGCQATWPGRGGEAPRPCGRPAVHVGRSGKPVCRAHGGVFRRRGPSGLPELVVAGDLGMYGRRLSERERIEAALVLPKQGIDEEIAMLRVNLARAMEGGDVGLVSQASAALVGAIKLRHLLSPASGDGLAASLARVLEEIGAQVGVPL